MAPTQLALSLLFILLPFGQLLRLDFSNFSLPVFDIALVIFTVLNIRQTKLSKPWLVFILCILISFVVAQITPTGDPRLPFLYLVRLLLLIVFINQSLPTINTKLVYISLASIVGFGLVQYFLFPDNTIMASLDWDPHLNRLVGSFLDPTFTALSYLFILIFLYLRKNRNYLLLLATYIALILTYSRSTLLAFVLVSGIYSFKTKQLKFFLAILLLVGFSLALLPKTAGEGTNLQRTSTIAAKIENYKEGIATFIQKPILGHGYNYLVNIRTNQGHASSGYDNSLLTILATTGLVGLFAFLYALRNKQYTNLGTYLTVAFLIHSFFANSLLYPMLIFLYKYLQDQKS